MTAIVEPALTGTLIESRTPDQWAQVVRADLGHAVAGFVAAGLHLMAAKSDIPHGGWESWCTDEVGISPGTARKLMAIADHPALSNRSHGNDLPPSWPTLYELSLLAPADLIEAIETGAVHHELERQEARAIVSSYKARAAMPEIRHGDFREVLADVAGAALILTDPPYGEKAVPLYADLAEWGAGALGPGGSLVAYTGQATLPGVLAAMQEHLRYWWTFAVEHNGGAWSLPGKKVLTEWKPAVWFVRDRRATTEFVADRIRGSQPDKDHAWAQGSAEAIYLIEQLTEPGDLVADPFSGSGTVGRAALSAGRKFIGADLPGMVAQ